MLADALRWVCLALALALAVSCCASIVWAQGWSQRLRFGVLLGYAVVTVGGQLDALGRPLTWRLIALTVTTVAAVVSTVAFVIQARRRALEVEGSPTGDARPASDQRRVLGPRAAAGGPRHARHSTEPEGGSAAS